MRIPSVVVGTIFCAVAAIGYTATNICLRMLAGMDADKFLAICVKESVTVIVIGPFLLWRWLTQGKAPVGWKPFLVLVLIGLAVQVVANVGSFWAYGVVGLAVTMSAVFATMILGSAALAFWLLGEPIHTRTTVAMISVVAAIVLLNYGVATGQHAANNNTSAVRANKKVLAAKQGLATAEADVENDANIERSSNNVPPEGEGVKILWAVLGVVVACIAGLIYAVLGIGIRWAATTGTPITAIVWIVTAAGVVSLSILAYFRLGLEGVANTDPAQLKWMVVSGVINLVSFLAISKGLQLVPVAHANIVNAAQVAMAAIAGVLLFDENLTVWLVLGVVLTVLGTLLVGTDSTDRSPKRAELLD